MENETIVKNVMKIAEEMGVEATSVNADLLNAAIGVYFYSGAALGIVLTGAAFASYKGIKHLVRYIEKTIEDKKKK